mgnify:CR=1 FL=1
MKYLLSILRILIGVSGGLFVILVVLFSVYLFIYKPISIGGDLVFSSGMGGTVLLALIVIGRAGIELFGIITFSLIILYFIFKYFSKKKITTTGLIP